MLSKYATLIMALFIVPTYCSAQMVFAESDEIPPDLEDSAYNMYENDLSERRASIHALQMASYRAEYPNASSTDIAFKSNLFESQIDSKKIALDDILNNYETFVYHIKKGSDNSLSFVTSTIGTQNSSFITYHTLTIYRPYQVKLSPTVSEKVGYEHITVYVGLATIIRAQYEIKERNFNLVDILGLDTRQPKTR